MKVSWNWYIISTKFCFKKKKAYFKAIKVYFLMGCNHSDINIMTIICSTYIFYAIFVWLKYKQFIIPYELLSMY